MRGPCINCEDRSPECHGKCEKYKEFDAERRKLREAREKSHASTYYPPFKMKRKRKKEI